MELLPRDLRFPVEIAKRNVHQVAHSRRPREWTFSNNQLESWIQTPEVKLAASMGVLVAHPIIWESKVLAWRLQTFRQKVSTISITNINITAQHKSYRNFLPRRCRPTFDSSPCLIHQNPPVQPSPQNIPSPCLCNAQIDANWEPRIF